MKFHNPPIIEIVLGVQFAPLSPWCGGHAGWFWKQFLGKEWKHTADAPLIGDLFEKFDTEQTWGPAGVSLFMAQSSPSRLQITNEDGDRMIQIQSTRFHYNWKKASGRYPSYETILKEFLANLNLFKKFINEAAVGEFAPNQWELTYVDHIPQGELWKTCDDWAGIFPGLFANPVKFPGAVAERTAIDCSYVMEGNRGRLHVQAHRGKASDKAEVELLSLQTTARGPIRADKKWTLEEGLELGHEAVTNMFLATSSANARRHWGAK
jgi:uncharacterized protein (TIGR04255 family)